MPLTSAGNGVEWRRHDILLSPAVLGALSALIVNDHIWKGAYHNWLTGKLSDVAGLFALTAIVAAWLPTARREMAAAIAPLFAFWKSSHSDSFIAIWNATLPWAIGRTVDLTDLLALLMLPPAVRYAARATATPLHLLWRSPRRLAVAVSALLAFAATSIAPTKVDLNVLYVFNGTPAMLFEQFRSSNALPSLDHVGNYSFHIPSTFCSGSSVVYAYGSVTTFGDDTFFTLERMSYQCGRKPGDREALERIFNEGVAKPAKLDFVGRRDAKPGSRTPVSTP